MPTVSSAISGDRIRSVEPTLERGHEAHQFEHFLLAKQIDLLVQQFDLQFGFHIDLVVGLRVVPVDRSLTVLAHHDDRGGVRCLKGQRQIEQNEGIGIPRPDPANDIDDDP